MAFESTTPAALAAGHEGAPDVARQQQQQQQQRQRRRGRIRTAVTVVAVLGLGMAAAVWQVHAGGHGSAGMVLLSDWLGQGLAYGLVAYALLHFSRKAPPGLAAVVACLVIVGTVNYQAYRAVSLDRQAIASLARSAPLLTKIQSGAVVTEQEVRAANVGMLEPLILAQAAYSRELIAHAEAFQKAVSALQTGQMLTPASLASPGLRAQTRARLGRWRQAMAEYKTGVHAATARGKLGVQAAQVQMPAAMAGSPAQGFDAWTAELGAFIDTLEASETEAMGKIAAILDLMDAQPRGYFLDPGPPADLVFREQAMLDSYRTLVGAVVAAGQREQEAKALLDKAQSERADKITGLLKR